MADGRTATLLTDVAAIAPGETVFITAGGGGVGSLLIQLALRAGATVISDASTPAKRELITALGANLKGPGPFTCSLVFDGVGGAVAREAFERLEPGGRMLSFGLASGAWADISEEEARARGVTLLRAGRPTREHTERALRSGLKPTIGQRFALEDAAAAHAAMESRQTIGKTLLHVAG